MERKADDERVSIPLDPREALKALLAVDPDSEPVDERNKPADKRADGTPTKKN